MATGRVLQFDNIRGYGFLAAEDGGEDIFLHASVFDGDTDELHPGRLVEFRIMASDRGRKAFDARLIAEDAHSEYKPVSAARTSAETPLAATPSVVQTLPIPAPQMPIESTTKDSSEDEQMCDVLSQAEFRQELTELLLDNAPELSGHQIQQVRRSVLEFAEKHGWVDI